MHSNKKVSRLFAKVMHLLMKVRIFDLTKISTIGFRKIRRGYNKSKLNDPLTWQAIKLDR